MKAFLRISLVSVMMFLITGAPLLAQSSRDFPTPTGTITDFSGEMTEHQIDVIRLALNEAYETNYMDGHVIITLSTDEWYLDEYVKDYADYLQGQGMLNSVSWLLYISTADHKFSLAAQDVAALSLTPSRKQEIYLILGSKLDNGDVHGAVMDAVSMIQSLPAPEFDMKKNNLTPGLIIFMGIVVIVITLMLRLRRTRMQT